MTKNILIVYASNSGSTFLVGEIIAKTLSEKYKVDLKKASNTSADDLEKYDVIILGSPSWSVLGKEAFPQEAMLAFMERCVDRKFLDKQCAAFGCGDSAYTLFCGAVNQLERFIMQIKGRKIMESLRIDAYYFKLKENEELAKQWAGELLKKIV